MDDRAEEKLEYEGRRQAQQQAAQISADAARKQVEKRLENPEFFQQLRDPDVDSEEFDWIEGDLGPLFSGAHLIGQRSDDYETYIKWDNLAARERVIKEGEPGRLCQGRLLKIAQKVQDRPDKSATEEYTRDEKRAIRDAFAASTALKSLSIGNKGLESVTQATAVQKTETTEDESSISERGASFLK